MRKEKTMERSDSPTEDIETLSQMRVQKPVFMLVSGLYSWSNQMKQPISYPVNTMPGSLSGPDVGTGMELTTETMAQAAEDSEAELSVPVLFQSELLRLDVDGRYPQMVASGTLSRGLKTRVHWIARLKSNGTNQWKGSIWYKDGATSMFPYTGVGISATRSWYTNHRKATVTFSGGGMPNRTLTYNYKSQYFHDVEFEYDRAEGVEPVTEINTCEHPNHPESLACGPLSIETVFRSAGFHVKKSGNTSIVPLTGTGSNATWSDMEMHDAMQTYWSRFDNRAQWSMWIFFAAMHDQGSSLGGIMFDDIGPNHRQGTAVFNNSFISNAPSGEANPAAWVKRMRFWTAAHEMGHCFNLAHSWQKSHPPDWGTPWTPIANENEARSFINYPYNVSGGQSAFFSDFEYRFSDSELLYMRHAPERFVQMGNAEWFDHHGFRQAEVTIEPKFRLEVRVNRAKPIYEFLEPIVIEMKLTNISPEVQLVDSDILQTNEKMTVILKRQDKPARQWTSFAQYCQQPKKMVLAPRKSAEEPGGSLYETMFISAGRNGWDLADPGNYLIQIALHMDECDIVSNKFMLRVAPPQNYDEEYLAQDFFTEDVGRVLAFDGSRFLTSANNTLHEVTDRLGKRKVALHARIALANPLSHDYKVMTVQEGMREMTSASLDHCKCKVISAKMDTARKEISSALMTKPLEAVETLSHIDYRYYVEKFSKWLAESGDRDTAMKFMDNLYRTLSDRNVSLLVLDEIKRTRDGLKPKREKAAAAKRGGRKIREARMHA